MIPWTRGALALLVLAAPVACGRFRSAPPTPTPHQRFVAALAALDSGHYAPATQALSALSQEYREQAVGRQALLATAAATVDPRNPQRQLDEGAALLGRYLRESRPDDWVQPLVQSLYLLSTELGGVADRAEQAEAAAVRALARADESQRALPQLPGAPVTARIDDLAHERDRLAAQVKELEATSAGLQKQLADTVQELKRVRRTLRP